MMPGSHDMSDTAAACGSPSLTLTDATGQTARVVFRTGDSLAEAVFTSGRVDAPALCAGIARCGRCRVRIKTSLPSDGTGEDSAPTPALLPPTPADTTVFSQAELDAGWRLACRHGAEGGLTVHLGPNLRLKAEVGVARSAAPSGALALAVDLGTTSLGWQVLRGDTVLAEGMRPNPQLGAGSEVVARLAYALRGEREGARLRELVLTALREIVEQLEEECDEGVGSLAIAGNTAMTALLVGAEVTPLARAPYGVPYAGDELVELAPDLPPAYLPPQPGPFLGGDVVAGLVALEDDAPPPPYLLLDLGTNGELVLTRAGGRLLGASVPMGPALEGVGLSSGTMAGPGATTGYDLSPTGLVPRKLPGQDVEGLTGTGYLSLIRRLLDVGLIDATGRFVADPPPLARRMGALSQDPRGEQQLTLPEGHLLRASDVETVLKVKAALASAIQILLREAGLTPQELTAVLLAGSFGQYVDPEDLTRLGFLPPGLGKRTRALGNTSLAGAACFLTRPESRERAGEIAARLSVLDLAATPDYQADYLAAMEFPHA